jgi:hypothetical protein
MTTIIEAPQIVLPLQATFLDAVDKGNHGSWKKCRYTEDEKKVLEPYKEEYRKITTNSERHNIIWRGITYWSIYSTTGMRKGLLLPR